MNFNSDEKTDYRSQGNDTALEQTIILQRRRYVKTYKHHRPRFLKYQTLSIIIGLTMKFSFNIVNIGIILAFPLNNMKIIRNPKEDNVN